MEREKKNSAVAAPIKHLEQCKKYTASVRGLEVKWSHEEAKGNVLEKKLKDLESEVEEKVEEWVEEWLT